MVALKKLQYVQYIPLTISRLLVLFNAYLPTAFVASGKLQIHKVLMNFLRY